MYNSTVIPSTSVASQHNEELLKSRLGLCEVCSTKEAKYTCPRCELKTCGLRCINIHKVELECNGSRDQTKYISLNKFSNLDLSSDYRLLEEITRNIKTLRKNWPHSRQNDVLPHHLFKLHNAAKLRRTTLKFLPRHFARHKENTTYLQFNSNVIYWHLMWIFACADNLQLVEIKVPEMSKLSNILRKYLIEPEDKLIREKLKFYRATDIPGIKFFLKAEQKTGHQFYELDALASIKDNLKDKIIIEYPEIHVVLKEHANLYNVVDSDEEVEEMDLTGTATGKVDVEKITQKVEKEESLNNSLKNLLFISGVSDENETDSE